MSQKGFFESLFDFSFSDFITTRLVKVLFGISVAVAALMGSITVIVALTSDSDATKVGGLIVGPVGFLLTVIWARLILEVMVVVFRIADHTRDSTAILADIRDSLASSGRSQMAVAASSDNPPAVEPKSGPVGQGFQGIRQKGVEHAEAASSGNLAESEGDTRMSPTDQFLAQPPRIWPTDPQVDGLSDAVEDSQAESERGFCTQCGAELVVGHQFCRQCGNPVS